MEPREWPSKNLAGRSFHHQGESEKGTKRGRRRRLTEGRGNRLGLDGKVTLGLDLGDGLGGRSHVGNERID